MIDISYWSIVLFIHAWEINCEFHVAELTSLQEEPVINQDGCDCERQVKYNFFLTPKDEVELLQNC